jgi:tetratricopeptide (TPR) repeat protein
VDLKQIKSLAERDQYDEALAECDGLLSGSTGKKADVLRMRAHVFALRGDYSNAVEGRETVLEMGEGTIKDYYRAADNALSAGQFAQAADWFKEVLRLGEGQNETWFKSASYFLLAYAQMELGQYQEAIANLDCAVAVEADVAMPLPGVCGTFSNQQLREEIRRHKNRK